MSQKQKGISSRFSSQKCCYWIASLQRVGLRAVLVEGAPADDRAHAADVALGAGGEADGPDRLGHGGGHGGGQGHEGHILVLINKKKKLCDTCNEKVSSRAVSILIPKA